MNTPLNIFTLWKSREWYVVLAITAVIFGFNVYRVATHQNTTSLDFVNYAQFVTPMKLHGTITKPHFIYPGLVALASLLFPGLSYTALGAGFVFLSDLFCATVLWMFWKKVVPISASTFIPLILTIFSMILAPVSIVTLFRHNLYIGYIAITTYHNPPLLLSRPLLLIHFLIFANALASLQVSKRLTIWSALLMILTTLTKPNYATIMLPASMLSALWTIWKKEMPTFRFIVLGTVLPAIAVLAWQYYFTFFTHYEADTTASVIFAPFLVYAARSHYLFPRFLLSILFPLGVLIVYGKEAMRDRFYMTGFMLFLFGAFESYFLAESGVRLYDGNFFFSGQIGLFLWFLVSMKFVLQDLYSKPKETRWNKSFVVLSSLFALHLISGVVWYACESIATGTFW
ncbi:MAG TPA: hypothetical protein VGM92_14655 [Candidatus Kapabacteria bacterium]